MTKYLLIGTLLLLQSFSIPAQRLLERTSKPHYADCFTQGFEINNNIVWESCGGFGKSKVFQWDLNTQKVLKQLPIDAKYFAEGLTQLNDSLFLITWKAGLAIEIDPETLQIKRNHRYTGEGWGLTNNGQELIMSNGSNTIKFINPNNFKVSRTIDVYINGQPLANLNELEYIDGKIWANVYQTDYIVIINPESGLVEKNYHLPNLLKDHIRKPGVLNGIAHDKYLNKTWVTGKNWPLLFEL